MNFNALMCLYKLMNASFNPQLRTDIFPNEIDLAAEELKKIADNTPYWTQYNKERYKMMVDCVKELSKSRPHNNCD